MSLVIRQVTNWFSFSANFPRSAGRLGSIEVVGGDDTDTLDFVNLVGFSLQFAPNGAFTAIPTFEQ